MHHSTYFMNDSREAGRLASKVNCKEWVSKYLSPYLSADACVLDVGCGPGHLSTEVAKMVNCVVGVDLHTERFPSSKLPENLTLQQGNANKLPFLDNTFDVAFSRFMIEYLPEKQNAVNELVRVTKPGGTVLLQDLDGQLLWHHPTSDDFDRMLNQAIDALQTTGFDPFVGRKLFGYLHTAGVSDIKIGVEPYHLIVGAIADLEKSQWELKLDIARNALGNLKTPEFANSVCSAFKAHLASDNTITYSIVFTVAGLVPESIGT